MEATAIGAVLTAIAAGGGEALSSQMWKALGALVRRPFRRGQPTRDTARAMPSGQAELAALAQAPASEERAIALAKALVARADADSEFSTALAIWWEQARQVKVGGNVSNTIGGGTQNGPLLQGRDFTGLTFGIPAQPPFPPVPDLGA